MATTALPAAGGKSSDLNLEESLPQDGGDGMRPCREGGGTWQSHRLGTPRAPAHTAAPGEGVGGRVAAPRGPGGDPGHPWHPAGWAPGAPGAPRSRLPQLRPPRHGHRRLGLGPPVLHLAGGAPFPPPPSLLRQPPSPPDSPGPVPGSALGAAGAAEPARSSADPPRPPAANKGAGTGHRRPLPAAGAMRRGPPPPPRGAAPVAPGELPPAGMLRRGERRGGEAAGGGAGARRERGREGRGKEPGKVQRSPGPPRGASRCPVRGKQGRMQHPQGWERGGTPLCSYSLLIYRPGALSSLHGQAFFLCLGRYS